MEIKILLIAYSFLPFQDGQSLRWYYLANALADLGVKIDVISVKHPDQNKVLWNLNESIKIYRIFAGFIETVALKAKKNLGVDDIGNREFRKTTRFTIMKSFYWGIRNLVGNLLPGDVRTEWFPFAIHFIKKNINLKKYAYLITSHEPWVDSLLGLYLKKKTGIKWVADFGDPYVAPYTPRHKLWFENYLERNIYENADALVFTNKGVINYLGNKYSFLKDKRLFLIEQGYSYRLCNEMRNGESKNEVFTLIYAGTFYRKFRNPSNLIKALSMLNFAYQFLLAGRNEQFIKDFEVLGDRFKFLGLVDHFNILRLQRKSDVLVHLSNKGALQVPGKFYEYLGALTPILCIVHDPEDPTRKFINQLKNGLSCKNDPFEIKAAIEVLYENWKDNKGMCQMDCNNIYDYSWEKKAEILYKNLENF